MTTLKKGDMAPNFTGTDQDGNPFSLSNYRGNSLILYFYPKNNTPGCTRQACSFRDGYEQLNGIGLQVVGVSPDSQLSHQKFIQKHSLPFTLIADTDRAIATLYGVYGEKKLYGKIVRGIHRTTFIINPNGTIKEVVRKVNTAQHVEQILKLLDK